jgi:hypothetical protein
LTVIAVRGGCLYAGAASGAAALILWAPPNTGKHYLREERAFQRMAARAFAPPPDDRPVLPVGAVEAGGFVHGPQVVAALEALAWSDMPADPSLGSVLILPREGAAAPPELLSCFEPSVKIRVQAASGVADLLDDPYKSALSASVTTAILAFLDEPLPQRDLATQAEIGTAARGAAAEVPPAGPVLSLSGGAERPWLHPGTSGELSGILCEPEEWRSDARWTLFFNAGGVRRSGPNRLWTRAARHLLASGRPSLRLDVRDVGDSDGSSVPHRDLEEMYAESSIEDAVAAYDAVRVLHRTRFGSDPLIDVVGLCSGAFLGVQVAARRDVARALLFNCLAYVWDDDARATGVTSQIARSLLDARRWGRLLTGRIAGRDVVTAVLRKARLTAEDWSARLRGGAPPSEVARLLREVALRGTSLHLVHSAGDPSIAYLERHVPEGERPRRTILAGVDHTIRPVWAHDAVVRLITSDNHAPE